MALLFPTCKKDNHPSTPSSDPRIEKAKHYFDSAIITLPKETANNPRAAAPRKVNWNQATLIDLAIGKAVLVPVVYENDIFIRTTQGGQNRFHLSNLTQLLVYQSNGVYHAEVLTNFPDTNYLRRPRGAFSGMIYAEDWSGNSIGKYLYESSGIRKYVAPTASTKQPLSVVSIETCYQVTGYNYSVDAPDEGESWAEEPVCRTTTISDNGDVAAADYGVVAVSGAGGTNSNSTLTLTIAAPHSIIQNISNYFACFTNVGGSDHKYTVSVCVDQPSPGTRTPWVLTSGGASGTSATQNPVDAGHTFLILTETYGNTVITRNVGFYPSGMVHQITPSSQAVLNDDESHEYNISGTFNVNNASFFQILNYISQANLTGSYYNLNYYNCTSFAIQAVGQGDINLPRTIGKWFDGSGNDPGDLGEDLRQNNIPGMTLNANNNDTPHPNVGQCN